VKCEEEAEPAPAKQNREGEALRKVKFKTTTKQEEAKQSWQGEGNTKGKYHAWLLT